MISSDIKVGKRTPFTLDHFKEFFALLPERSDSDRSWTIDFMDQKEKAQTAAAPFRKEAEKFREKVAGLKKKRSDQKKAKAGPHKIEALDLQIKEATKAGREADKRAEALEVAVYDLKAVNPNASSNQDTRTPSELLDIIAAEGEVINKALARLRS